MPKIFGGVFHDHESLIIRLDMAAALSSKTPMDILAASLDESARNAMRTAGLASIADSVYITEDGSITGKPPARKARTLALVDEVGVLKKNFVKNTLYKVFGSMFTFLPPESDTAIQQVVNAFTDLHRSGVSLRMLMSLPPGKYISVKSPTSEDRIYFYRSMTDSGNIYFYSGFGKRGASAKLGLLMKRLWGRVSNRYGTTNIAPDNDALRTIIRSFIQVHADVKDIPAGRHTRRRRGNIRKTRKRGCK
jgi:hypothetical protein